MKNPSTYLSEVKAELEKVTWPKKDEIIKLTAIVIAISVIVGAYIGGLDYLFTRMSEYLISLN